MLDRYCRDLLLIKRRLYLLREIDKVIAEHVEPSTGQIQVRNMAVYEGVRDIYAMLVIDLSSFCKHFGEAGGFIMQLNNHLSHLKPANPKKIDVPDPMVLGALSLEHHAEIVRDSRIYRRKQISEATINSLKQLFPGWVPGEKVTQERVDSLRGRFVDAVEKLQDDRNVHRAHRYENDSRKRAGATPPLNLTDIENAFKIVEDLLGNLWMVADTASYAFDSDLNGGSGTHNTARDLADLMIFGSINNLVNEIGISQELKARDAEKTWFWQFREIFEPKAQPGAETADPVDG